ncbi:hypothetical protein RM578_08520 [Staphylococcus haemolyticus]|uniref:hypothetical protein n=1 Tax=Staphylococcus haemolyticus TaxID=1283 RepID=UPI00288586A1|nr:hypothetical protein [Staphylococcus haemolyticus]MDT0705678.1 hypothetical protein [Staphylococcus haemolyticus]MDT0738492.1 hypothetical protein [Staphylococcus haemolyticus]
MTRTEKKLDLGAFSVQSATANLQNSIIILLMSQALPALILTIIGQQLRYHCLSWVSDITG